MKPPSACVARATWAAVVLLAVAPASAFELTSGVNPDEGRLRRAPDAMAEFVAQAAVDPAPMEAKTSPAAKQPRQAFPAKMPLSFEPCADGARECFVARGVGYALYLTPGEAALRLSGAAKGEAGSASVVRMKFASANGKAAMHAEERRRGVSNYYRGNDPAKWRTGVPHFGKVRYEAIYPGIDLVFYGNGRELEYDLVVAPGADPGRIRIELEGANTTNLDSSGNLVLQTAAGPLRLRKPIVYQHIDGIRRVIDAGFALVPVEAQSGATRANPEVAFRLAQYDATQPLVIDPIFDFTAGFGGTMRDEAFAVAAGPGGLICVVGSTTSADFPLIEDGGQSAANAPTGLASIDAWIAYLNGDGEFLASTTFGGDEDDEALDVALDRFGNAHVTGYTKSENFPVQGSFAQPYGGLGDAFMAGFSISGASLYALYYGGSGIDQGNGIAVGTDHSVYVSGWTLSTDLPLVNPLQATKGGLSDFFVAKLNSSTSLYDYATYLGGNNHEHPTGGFIENSNRPSGGIDVDTEGNAYVAGTTFSANFPKVNAYSPTAGGVFFSKLNPSGSGLLYSSGFGSGRGCAIDANDDGHVVLAGLTMSESFPVRNAFQSTYGGSTDAFVMQVDSTKSGDASLMFSSYYGGDAYDGTYGVQYVRVTGGPQVAVAGRTGSPNMPFAAEPSGGSIFKSTDAGATWTKTNNGLISADVSFSAAQVNCIAVDPANDQIVYAGTESAGVYKSVNGGGLWQPMNAGIEDNGSIQAVAVDPQDSNRLYALTFQNGIFVWSGAAWMQRSGSLAITAERSNFVFGAPGSVYVHAFQGVFGSPDSGMTWTEMSTGLPQGVSSLAIDSTNPNRLLAGHFTGMYFSSNAGFSWEQSNGNLADALGGDADGEFAVDDVWIWGAMRCALVGSSFENPGGLFKSEDDGATYTSVLRFGDPEGAVDPTFGVKAYSAGVLGIDPTNLDNILIGTGRTTTGTNSGLGVLSTSNGGESWTSSGPVGTEINAFALGRMAANVSAWYVATSGGDDGIVATVPLDGSAPTTDIVGNTGEDELRSVARDDYPLDGSPIFDALFYYAGNSAYITADDLSPEVVQPPSNSVPPGPIIPPAEPENVILGAEPPAAAASASADLEVIKEMSITGPSEKKEVFCRITVTNKGPDAATNVKVTEHGSNFKTPATDSSANPASSVSPTNQNTRTYDLGDMPAGSTKEVALFFPVYNSTGEDLGKTRRNAAQAYMESGNVQDPVLTNDLAFAEIAIPQTPPGDIPPQTANQSTRVVVGTGDRAPNSGTIITAPQQQQQHRRKLSANATAGGKKVIFRAIGPSLQSGGTPVEGRLADPTLELYDGEGTLIGTNDNWRQTQIGGVITSDQVAEIEASTIPPTHDLESAIVADLNAAVYTAVIRGVGDTTGIALAEVYDLDSAGELRLANISTRGFVETGGNVMIGGVILLGTESQRMVFRALGPSLSGAGVPDALQDPVLDLVDSNGSLVRSNNNWRSDQEAELIATTIPPSHDAEAAIVAILTPGAYTAVVSGANGGTGVGLVEVYNLGVSNGAAIK